MSAPQEQPRSLAQPDREEIKAAAHRFFDAGLCCVVEAESGNGTRSWQPQLVAFRSSTPARVLDAVEDTVARCPGARVRVVGYDSRKLVPAASAAPIVCSPPIEDGRSMASVAAR